MNIDNFEIPLFWNEDYLKIHKGFHKVLNLNFNTSNIESENIKFWFNYTDIDLLKSPGRATFGGIWPSRINLNVETNMNLLNLVFNQFKDYDVFQFTFPPSSFYPEIFSNQISAALELGGNIRYQDLNFHVDLESWTTKSLSRGNQKKLRIFKENSGITEFADNSEIDECYEVLMKNRERRGVTLSMSNTIFNDFLRIIPDKFFLIKACMEESIIATAFVIKITKTYWYVLFWGELPEFRNFSPVVAILDFLVTEAKKSGVRILDLGISTHEGTVDEGLVRFKKNLGAVESNKLTLLFNK